jgi:CRISPR/Cas system-associated exonuclease Cas4 (RecB family)
VTLRISWSSLRTHDECRQKGKLQRERKQATLENTRVFFPGTVTDRVVRDWLKDAPLDNPGVMPDMVEMIVKREKTEIDESSDKGVVAWKSIGDRDKIIRDCQEAVTKIEPALNRLVLPFDFEADHHFQTPIMAPHPDGGMERIILNGFIDILVKDPVSDKWRIYDVKMTRDDSYWRKTVGQLTFYDLAITSGYGGEVDEVALLQPLCKERVKGYPLNDNVRAQIMQRISNMAYKVWSEDFEPRRDTKICNFCSVKHACPKFQPTVVNGRKRVSF